MDSASSSGKRQPQGLQPRALLAASWGESAEAMPRAVGAQLAGISSLKTGNARRVLHQDLSSSATLWEATPQPKIKDLHEDLRKKGAPCLSGFSIQVCINQMNAACQVCFIISCMLIWVLQSIQTL